VHKERLLILTGVPDAEAPMVKGLQMLAGKLAADDITAKLQGIADGESNDYKQTVEELRRKTKAMMLEYWESTPAFALVQPLLHPLF